jgi:uncharacterized membrane protein
MCRNVGDARQRQTPSNVVMRNTTPSLMGGYGLWMVLGVLLSILLVVAIYKMVQKK